MWLKLQIDDARFMGLKHDASLAWVGVSGPTPTLIAVLLPNARSC